MALGYVPSDAESFEGINPPIHLVTAGSMAEIKAAWAGVVQSDAAGDHKTMINYLVKALCGQMKFSKNIDEYLIKGDCILDETSLQVQADPRKKTTLKI